MPTLVAFFISSVILFMAVLDTLTLAVTLILGYRSSTWMGNIKYWLKIYKSMIVDPKNELAY